MIALTTSRGEGTHKDAACPHMTSVTVKTEATFSLSTRCPYTRGRSGGRRGGGVGGSHEVGEVWRGRGRGGAGLEGGATQEAGAEPRETQRRGVGSGPASQGRGCREHLCQPSRSWSRALFWWLLPAPSGVWVHPSLPSSLLPSIPCIWACIPFPNRFALDPVLPSPQTTGQRPCLVPCSPSLPPASSSP